MGYSVKRRVMLDVFSYLALRQANYRQLKQRQRNALFRTSSLSFIQSFLLICQMLVFFFFQELNSKELYPGLYLNIKSKRKSFSTYYLSIKVFLWLYNFLKLCQHKWNNGIIVLKLLTQRAWSQWVPVLAPSHLLPLRSRSDSDEERRQKTIRYLTIHSSLRPEQWNFAPLQKSHQNHRYMCKQKPCNKCYERASMQACITGALWAKRGERGILRSAKRVRGARRGEEIIFPLFSSRD